MGEFRIAPRAASSGSPSGPTTSLGLFGLYLSFLAKSVPGALINYYRFRSEKWKAISRGYRPGEPVVDD